MNSINTVTLSGNATRDPEHKTLQGGTSVAEFGLAVTRSRKSGDEWVEETSFFDITVFGGFADLVARKLTKGDLVSVEGSLRQDRWENEAGENRSKVKVIADRIVGEFQFRKNGVQVEAPAAQPELASAPAAGGQDDDIPF